MVDGFFYELNEAAEEAPEVSKEEVSLATEIMHSFVKTAKGFRMYLPNNPLLVRFIEELMGRMNQHLSLYGEFRLDIDQFELRYKGNAVYKNSDPKDSMSFKMYSDGIRYLIFSEGVEEFELCGFLEIIGKERPNEVDDDIVTLLWERNFPHITYILAEDFLEFSTSTGGGGQIPGGSQQEQITGIFQNISSQPAPATVPKMFASQNVLILTVEETEWLRKAKEAEEERKPLEEVIQIVAAILTGEKDPEMFGDFVDIMAKLTESLANVGEMNYAFNLLKFMGKMAKSESIPSSHREIIARAMPEIFTDRTVLMLARTLDNTDLISPQELLEILHLVGSHSIGRICELLGLVDKMKMRRAIIQGLLDIGHDAPEAFFPCLSDPKWFVVRNIIYILSQMDCASALEHVVGLINHKEPRVRREVLTYLENCQDPKAKSYILKFLRDETSPLRIRAIQVLGSSGCGFALKPITAIALAEQFVEKDMLERKVVYEVIGELGKDQMIPMFRDMLMKKYWFNKSREKETVILAVSGLRKIQSDAAVKLLEEAKEAKGEEMRQIIVSAIESMRSPAKAATALPEEN